MLNVAFFDTTTFFLPRIDLGKIWSLFKVTEKPRFTYVQSVRDTQSDPREPQLLGTIYHDQNMRKNYFVAKDVFSERGVDYVEVYSVSEIDSPKTIPHIVTASDIKSTLILKPVDVDVESDMMDQLKREAEEAGMVFCDLRERDHGSGAQQTSAPTNSQKIWGLFKMTEPRFTHLQPVRDTGWDDPREPKWFGAIYRDRAQEKNYLVRQDVDSDWGGYYVAVFSIKEIISPKTFPEKITDKEVQSAFVLKAADIDVENDMMDQIKREAEKSGMTFRDSRERDHGSGAQQASAKTNSLS